MLHGGNRLMFRCRATRPSRGGPNKSWRTLAARYCLLGALVAAVLGAQPTSTDLFETKIRPILVTKCYMCHSSTLKTPMGGLMLDTKAGLLKGGASGPVVVPGKPAESRMLQALRYTDTHLQMPPKGKLSD